MAKIPKFKSEKEEAEFWNKHSLADFDKELKPAKNVKMNKKLKTTNNRSKKTNESFWTHFILEAFCGYSFMRYKTMLTAPVDKTINDFLKKDGSKIKYKRRKNTSYIDAKPCNSPNQPHPDNCLNYNNKTQLCPFFLWTQVEDHEYKTMIKALEKLPDKKNL